MYSSDKNFLEKIENLKKKLTILGIFWCRGNGCDVPILICTNKKELSVRKIDWDANNRGYGYKSISFRKNVTSIANLVVIHMLQYVNVVNTVRTCHNTHAYTRKWFISIMNLEIYSLKCRIWNECIFELKKLTNCADYRPTRIGIDIRICEKR